MHFNAKVALCGVLVALVSLAPTGAAKTAKEVTISYQDYCLSCIVTIEEFARQVHDELSSRVVKMAPPGMAREVDGNKLIKHLCESKLFLDYRPGIRSGCLKITQEHLASTLGRLDGQHTEANWTEIREITREACVEIDACKEGAPLLSERYQIDEADDCASCKAIVADIQHITMRLRDETKKDRKKFAGIIDGLCYEVGLRHQEHVDYLTDFCDEMIEDIGARTLAGTIQLRNRLSKGGMQVSGSLEDKVCAGLSDYCEKPEGVEL